MYLEMLVNKNFHILFYMILYSDVEKIEMRHFPFSPQEVVIHTSRKMLYFFPSKDSTKKLCWNEK